MQVDNWGVDVGVMFELVLDIPRVEGWKKTPLELAENYL